MYVWDADLCNYIKVFISLIPVFSFFCWGWSVHYHYRAVTLFYQGGLSTYMYINQPAWHSLEAIFSSYSWDSTFIIIPTSSTIKSFKSSIFIFYMLKYFYHRISFWENQISVAFGSELFIKLNLVWQRS